MAAPTTERSTAAERRDEILDAALIEFAERGLHGTSTERIAKRAGISQPYIFRLFGTKKDLFIATVERCMEQTLALFRSSAGGKVRRRRADAIAAAYRGVLENPVMLRGQMQAYVASDDPDVRAAVRLGYGRLVEFAEQASGAPKDTDHGVLRARDADERDRVDGPARRARALGGRGCSRAAARSRNPFFCTICK